MKRIALSLLAVGFAVSAACGGSAATTTQNAATPTTSKGSPAHRAYNAFMSKYAAEMADLKAAFPDTSTPAEDPWTEAIADACAPEDASGEGMAIMMLTPVLAKYDHGYVEFKADINKVNESIRDEGLCDKPLATP